ncbi:MAG: RsmE family RNA methyltransferase [Dehalococcoidia bacterium]
MPRFFLPPEAIHGREAVLPPTLARRLYRVLRLHPGERLLLVDGSGKEYEAELTSLSAAGGTAVVTAEREAANEPGLRLVLYPSLIKANRFDLVLEKGTELGVTAFAPVVCQRSVARPDDPAAKAERWRRLVLEAAEQCGRARSPDVSPPLPFAQAMGSAPGLKLLPWEGESALGMRSFLQGLEGPVDTVSLFLGPEGGFTAAEVELARRQGAAVVSLGRRILRAETAAIVAAAIVLHELGEMGD